MVETGALFLDWYGAIRLQDQPKLLLRSLERRGGEVSLRAPAMLCDVHLEDRLEVGVDGADSLCGSLGGSTGMVPALGFAALMNGGAYWFSDRLAIRRSHAQPVSREQEPHLYGMIEDLAHRAGVPVPKVYIIDDASPNAFATGRNPAHAAVAVTRGIMDLLNTRELYGVLAHEFAHIKHRDILLSSITATIAGAITALANVFQLAALFGHQDEDGEGPGLMSSLALFLLAPIAATLTQLAISRAREFAADAAGANLVADPLSLARALQKLEQGTWVRPMDVNPATASMYTVHPFAGGGMVRLFQTHPPIADRVARLEAIARETVPGATAAT